MLEIARVIGDEDRIGDETVALLDDHAAEMGHPFKIEKIAFVATVGGARAGSVLATRLYDWAFVKYLAVEPAHRGAGVGSALIAEVEEAARAGGAVGVFVDTYGHQAPTFYPRLGYVRFGALPTDDPARTRHFFSKIFAQA